MNISNLIEKVAHRMTNISGGTIDEVCPIGIIDINNWEWPQGVGLFGLYKYYQFSGKKDYLDFIMDWFNKRINEGLPQKNVNTMAPMLTLAYIYEETKDEKYLTLCKEWAQWIMDEMPRTKYGGLQHIVTGEINKNQLWDDTLFMTVLFLAKIGVMTNEQSYIEESKKQFLLHIQFLCDKKTGLWYHGWTFEGNHNFANALWARGNSWITVGIPEYIDITGIEGGIKQYLLDVLSMQIEALAKYQNDNGMWHTLINDPDTYVETSATAGFGYGILKSARLGYIDKKYKTIGEKALKAVIDRIAEDGTVKEVSYGTGMGGDLEYYKKIPCCPMTYGQALTVLLLTEGVR